MADRSPRDIHNYRDFGIDPELVAAPALEDEDEPLHLDTLPWVEAYLGAEAEPVVEAPGDHDDDETQATATDAAYTESADADASGAAAPVAGDERVDDAVSGDVPLIEDASSADRVDEVNPSAAEAAGAAAVTGGALMGAEREGADDGADNDSVEGDGVDAETETAAAADPDTDATASDPTAADPTASDPDDEPVEVQLDEDAPSATASAANASEAATSDESSSSFTAAPAGGKTRRRRRGAMRSRAQERRRKGAAATVARAVGTVATIGIVAASVWALGWMQLPNFTAQAEPVSVTPQPGEQLRVCPGPLQQLGVSSDASEITSVGDPTIADAAAGAEPEATDLGDGGPGNGPSVLSVPGTVDGEITQLSAAQTLIASGGDTSGFSATACMQPSSSQWLLAGDTTVGHTLVLDVVNPGNVEARVNFAVYDNMGVVSPSIPEAVIQPGERQEISLAGISPDSASLAIQVTSTGSEVASYLHETVTNSLNPAGSDIVGPSALPSTEQVLPGFYVYQRSHDDETASTSVGSALRIANPNDTGANAVMNIFSAEGEQVEQIDLPMEPNTVINYPITTLPGGAYTVQVTSDEPVAISGRVAPLQPDEFGWQPSSPTLSDSVTVAVPSGPNATLSLANFGEDARTVTIDGDEVTIEPGATERVDNASGEIELSGVEGLYAAVNYSEGGRIANFPVQPGNADAEPIRVTR